MKLKNLDEDILVAEIIRDFSPNRGILESGIGDDAAVVRCGKDRILLSKDLLIEEVHFLQEIHPPRLLGRKSLSVNISDIAAMGGRPESALLGLGLPPDISPDWVKEFFSGFRSCLKENKIFLIGGDISRSKKIVISVTITGKAGKILRRSGAASGDAVYVSGSLGDAAFGLELLKKRNHPDENHTQSRLFQAFLDPSPRVELGNYLAENQLASALMDLSDGLSRDLPRLCSMSRTGAEITADKIPLSEALKKHSPNPLRYAVHGGEDYELLFTVPPSKEKKILSLQDRFSLTRIGRITATPEIWLVDENGVRTGLKPEGFAHFE